MAHMVSGPIRKISMKLSVKKGIVGYKKYLSGLESRIWEGIGDKTSAPKDKSGVVYYPFGGMDVFAPFALFSKATDVVSVGLDNFGSAKDILKFSNEFIKQEPSFMRMVFDNFDFVDNFDFMETFRQGNDLSGLGPVAIARIIGLLGGKVEGLHYFNVNSTPQESRLEFLNTKDIQDGKKCRPDPPAKACGAWRAGPIGAVVTFNVDGVEKRFWYIQNDFRVNNEAFNRFINTESLFQILLIKGAMSVSCRIDMNNSVLSAAKRNNVLAVTDSGLNELYPIFDKYDPAELRQINTKYRFGYGYSVHYCAGTNLKGQE